MKDAQFLMEREKKKRMMPRHLLSAAVMSGIVPYDKVDKNNLTEE
jgi:hypothetical protein